MIQRAAVLLAALATMTGAARGESKNDTVFGPGVRTCANFLQAAKDAHTSQFTLWTLGYVSSLSRDAHNLAGAGAHTPFIARFQNEIYGEGKGYDAFESRLKTRCEEAPKLTYEEAVWAEIESMNGATP